ncbi:MAG: hypothetical protein AVDCRST_MAG25-3404, partial [uncultured Rubrobacteraceae bacterium]
WRSPRRGRPVPALARRCGRRSTLPPPGGSPLSCAGPCRAFLPMPRSAVLWRAGSRRRLSPARRARRCGRQSG